jgi:hypothetical protein
MMKSMLERTVEVKLEYETVIKQLLLEEATKDLVVEICRRNRGGSDSEGVVTSRASDNME